MDKTLNTTNLDEATTRYDVEFRSVEGLTWLPWVGQKFSERPPHKRLLVVGESHYYHEYTTPEEREAKRVDYLNDLQCTRNQVSQALVNHSWEGGNRTLDTIPKLFFKTTEIDHPRLWGDSAYYNFIQRPMDYNQEGQPERPTWDDFVIGWKTFTEVIRIIQPSHCLFIGVAASGSFNFTMTSQNFSFEKISWPKKIGRTWARMAKLEVAGTTTELIFVQHLGKYFSWSQWHDYLQFQHANFMGWLGAESYVINHNAQSIAEPTPVLT